MALALPGIIRQPDPAAMFREKNSELWRFNQQMDAQRRLIDALEAIVIAQQGRQNTAGNALRGEAFIHITLQ
ncbi:MAG: hypothetical protein WBQ69_04970, partial [Gallionella sp.]